MGGHYVLIVCQPEREISHLRLNHIYKNLCQAKTSS